MGIKLAGFKRNESATERMGRVVPVVGLAYLVALLLFQVLTALGGSEGASFRAVIFIPFIGMFALGSLGVWKRSRWGYFMGATASAAFVLLGLPYNLPIFVNPTDPLFLTVWTGNVAPIVVTIYIAVGYAMTWRARNVQGTVTVSEGQ